MPSFSSSIFSQSTCWIIRRSERVMMRWSRGPVDRKSGRGLERIASKDQQCMGMLKRGIVTRMGRIGEMENRLARRRFSRLRTRLRLEQCDPINPTYVLWASSSHSGADRSFGHRPQTWNPAASTSHQSLLESRSSNSSTPLRCPDSKRLTPSKLPNIACQITPVSTPPSSISSSNRILEPKMLLPR